MRCNRDFSSFVTQRDPNAGLPRPSRRFGYFTPSNILLGWVPIKIYSVGFGQQDEGPEFAHSLLSEGSDPEFVL
jgi:hypothetical protein